MSLVWLPFDPERLGDQPDSLRYEVVRPGEGELLASVGEVEFYVPPYQMGPVDPGLFEQMTSLRVVQTMTAGVDHIRPALPEGVLLCNGAGIHDTATSELAVTLTLAVLNRLPEYAAAREEGQWLRGSRRGLADKSVLIVGYGRIGTAIARRLEPFECSITRVARSAREGVHGIGDLPALMPDADVVILILPGTTETRGLIDAAMLARMKDGAVLVNLARGPVVDTDALLDELTAGRIHAALDVTDPEPLPPGHPLWAAPNLILTPHVGGASDAMWPRAYRVVRDQLHRFAAGEPLANQMTGDY